MPSKTQTSFTLSEAVSAYLDYCEVEQEFRPESMSQYRKILREILEIVGDRDVICIDQSHIVILKKSYIARELQSTTKALRFSVLRNLLRFCRDELRVDTIDPDTIKRPTISKKRVDYLTEEELKRFFESIGRKNKRDFRFRAFLAVLIATGYRISEALNLRGSGIDWQNKEATIIGKGNKQRKLYFTDWSLQCIREYLASKDFTNDFIFTAEGKTRGRWDRLDAERTFRRYRRKVQLNENVTAHTIRHSFATLLLKKNISLGHIQTLLGHSDIQTTSRHYLGILSDDEAKKAHEKGMDMGLWS